MSVGLLSECGLLFRDDDTHPIVNQNHDMPNQIINRSRVIIKVHEAGLSSADQRKPESLLRGEREGDPFRDTAAQHHLRPCIPQLVNGINLRPTIDLFVLLVRYRRTVVHHGTPNTVYDEAPTFQNHDV